MADKMIEHSGTIVAIGVGVLKVEIVSSAACGECSAGALCSAAEKRRKVVDVLPTPGRDYALGDTITFVGEQSMGARAVVFAYVIPLLLVVAGLVCAHVAGLGDGGCALVALATLVPYYAALWLLRGRIDKSFKFKAKNQ